MSRRYRSRSPRGGAPPPRKSKFSSRFDEENLDIKEYMQGLESVKSSQNTKVDRKLYVGNLPAGVTQSQLVDLLNTALINKRLNSYTGNPVLSAWISQDGHYAFVEFRSIEEANKAFSLNNYPILGQNLKVGRPKTYTGSQPASTTDRNAIMGGYSIPTISAFVSAGDATKQGPLKPTKVWIPSNVLRCHSILSENDLADEASFEATMKDISALASEQGFLLQAFAPREGRYAKDVFLEYYTIEEARVTRNFLSKKRFDGKPLQISYISSEKFHERELDDTEDLQLLINT
mmetsp:Transcript_20969/g.38835  ORF Transcript_20969/g.38835 Transcript_20969/m.38835 type:complete len:290 (-) Transcript_20969:983-1852(-)